MTFSVNSTQLVCVARPVALRPTTAAVMLAGNIAGRKPEFALPGGVDII